MTLKRMVKFLVHFNLIGFELPELRDRIRQVNSADVLSSCINKLGDRMTRLAFASIHKQIDK